MLRAPDDAVLWQMTALEAKLEEVATENVHMEIAAQHQTEAAAAQLASAVRFFPVVEPVRARCTILMMCRVYATRCCARCVPSRRLRSTRRRSRPAQHSSPLDGRCAGLAAHIDDPACRLTQHVSHVILDMHLGCQGRERGAPAAHSGLQWLVHRAAAQGRAGATHDGWVTGG